MRKEEENMSKWQELLVRCSSCETTLPQVDLRPKHWILLSLSRCRHGPAGMSSVLNKYQLLITSRKPRCPLHFAGWLSMRRERNRKVGDLSLLHGKPAPQPTRRLQVILARRT